MATVTLTMPPDKGAAFLRALQPALIQGIVQAETKNIQSAEAEAIRASSGTHSTAELQKAGHPYARRAPNKSYNPAIINSQTGAFRSGWHKTLPVVQSDAGGVTITTRLFNSDPKARFMGGTKTMVPRPIIARVEGRTNTARVVCLRQAGANAYKKASQ